MKSKILLVPAFILIAVLQLLVPSKMIYDREDVLKAGKEFKFKAAPVDPNDPFRGKYITLSFTNNTIQVLNKKEWKRNEVVYVNFTTDQEGYAIIESISKEEPTDNPYFLETNVSGVGFLNSRNITIDYPFERYYMDEFKAKETEDIYRETVRDTDSETYALVYIKEGLSVLKDVVLDGVSIKEMAEKKKESQ